VVNAKDKKDQTALLHAVELNHYSVAQILIDRISATQGPRVFVPSIRRAVMNGHDRILKLLLDQGVSTETKMTERGGTRLLYAAAERELASTVCLLLENGARVLTDSEIDTQAAVGMPLTFTNANDYIYDKGKIWGTFKTTLAVECADIETFTTACCNARNSMSEAACLFPYIA